MVTLASDTQLSKHNLKSDQKFLFVIIVIRNPVALSEKLLQLDLDDHLQTNVVVVQVKFLSNSGLQ